MKIYSMKICNSKIFQFMVSWFYNNFHACIIICLCGECTPLLTPYISLHYCRCHELNWLKLAEVSRLMAKQEISTLILLVRMILQLPFYQPPFSGQSQTLTVLGVFLLFTTLEHSFQSQMQQLLWILQFLQLLWGLDWILVTWQTLWGSYCGWMNWRWVENVCERYLYTLVCV